MYFRTKLNVLTLTLFIITLLFSCKKDNVTITNSNNCIKGEGTITTSTITINDFTGVDLAFSNNVTIKQGSSQHVEVTGHPNIIEKIKTEVTNNIWYIGFQDGCYEDYELSVEITVPNINSLKLSGSGHLLVQNFSSQSGILSMYLSGSGNLTLNEFEGITNNVTTLSGSGDIVMNNDITSLQSLNLTISGSGKYAGFEMISDNCVIHSTGSGHSEIKTQNTLDVTLSGSGNIYYKGTPTITEDLSGSGSLIDAN